MSFFDKAKSMAGDAISQAKKATRPKRNYKLTYFNLRGVAETSRLVFAAGEEPYVDDRVPFIRRDDGSFDRGNWEQLKPTFTFHQVPCLQFDQDGKQVQICQSRAIERFLARTFDLYGSNDVDAANIDQVTEHIQDMRVGYNTAKAKDTVAKENGKTFAAGESYEDKYVATLPATLNLLEKYIVKLGSKEFAFNNKLSLADIQIYSWLSSLPAEAQTQLLAGNPTIAAIFKKVPEVPTIAAYLAKRPETMF